MTTTRKDILLGLIPEAPASRTAPELLSDIERTAPGFSATLRTIQRELDALQDTPGLQREDSKPHRWSWGPGRKRATLARMEPEAALAFGLLEQHLDALIPNAVRTHLEPYFLKARDVVGEMSHSRLKRWKNRTTSCSRAFPLLLPEVEPAVLRAVQESLLDRVQLAMHYQSAGADQPRVYTVHPQGLVLSDGVFYLVATVAKYDDLFQFALHRMHAAAATTESSRDVPGFDVEAYTRDVEGFHFGSGDTIRLKLRVRGFLALHLRERPLAGDQKIKNIDDEWSELTATVAESWQLEWWLRSFGALCEVVRPVRLRRVMADEAREVCRVYDEEVR